MKKIIFLLVSILFSQLKSQEYKVKVEIDNSQRYVYESTYYKLKAEQYNQEIADGIKNYADKYFTNLQRAVDIKFNNAKNINYNRLNIEIERLKKYGTNILDLLYKLQNDELTASNMEYTIAKAFDELNYSNQYGELYKIQIEMQNNTLTKMVDEMFESQSEESLLKYIQSKNGKSRTILWEEFLKYPEDIRFQKFLVLEARKL